MAIIVLFQVLKVNSLIDGGTILDFAGGPQDPLRTLSRLSARFGQEVARFGQEKEPILVSLDTSS